jgi:hypothetical protein
MQEYDISSITSGAAVKNILALENFLHSLKRAARL